MAIAGVSTFHMCLLLKKTLYFVQGMQHPRIFGRGHIGRGLANIMRGEGISLEMLPVVRRQATRRTVIRRTFPSSSRSQHANLHVPEGGSWSF
jgi:hypothetical protein